VTSIVDFTRQTPILSRQSSVIRAPIEHVWHLLADIDRWSEWHPDIQHAELSGSLVPNAVFHWEFGERSLSSRVDEVIPFKKLSWSGQAGVGWTVHVWTFAPISDGVRIEAEILWDGPLLRREASELRRALDSELARWLALLKDDVEHRMPFVRDVLEE
jgi:uncharacterized protein YndB with AHSA1/START domain